MSTEMTRSAAVPPHRAEADSVEGRSPRPVGPPLALVGCDFRVASASWRGALALSREERKELHDRLAQTAGASGLVVIETCNRTEWLAESPEPEWTAEILRAWMVRRWRERSGSSHLPTPLALTGAAAARHFIRVAVGLESFVAGEREIAGQCRRALLTARAEHSSSPLIDALGQAAARTVRRVDRLCRFRDAGRGTHALVHDFLAVRLARSEGSMRVGVVGVGEIGRRIQDTLARGRAFEVTCFNRTPRPELGGRCLPLAALPDHAASLDALVVASGAPEPIVDVADIAVDRGERPLLVLDLGATPQVAPLREPLPAVTVASLDDLLALRATSIEEGPRRVAEEAVDMGVEEFQLAWQVRTAARVLAAAQHSRSRLESEKLPHLLDEHVGDLTPARRRRLEAALRSLLRDQHRDLLDQVRHATTPSEPSA